MEEIMRFFKWSLLLLMGTFLIPVMATAEGEAKLEPQGVEEKTDLEKKLEKKLKKDFVTKVDWMTDFNKAKEKAEKEKKVIFAYFTRSYSPCPPCIRLESGPFLTDEFVEFAKDKVMYLSIASQVPGREYDNMLGAYGFRGFPSIAVLSAGGANLSSPEERNVAAFKTAVTKAKKMIKEEADVVAAKEKEAAEAIKKAHKKKGFMGVQAAGETGEEKGVAIDPIEGQAAAKAGMQKGDSVYEVDGEEITSIQELAAYLSDKEPGYEIIVKFLRGGEEKSVQFKLGAR